MEIQSDKTSKKKSRLATIAGLLTSFGMAATIDWDHFDFHNPAHCCKLFVCIAPAIGGWISQIK